MLLMDQKNRDYLTLDWGSQSQRAHHLISGSLLAWANSEKKS